LYRPSLGDYSQPSQTVRLPSLFSSPPPPSSSCFPEELAFSDRVGIRDPGANPASEEAFPGCGSGSEFKTRETLLPIVGSMAKSTRSDAQALIHSLYSAYSATPTNLKIIDLYVFFAVLTAIVQNIMYN
ncbi:hypothetical protein Taro_022910, partial [Colocasia esculenta]|nr:hypothetical protein [Colocasia esculenta]